MRENTDQKNFEYRYVFRTVVGWQEYQCSISIPLENEHGGLVEIG